MEEYANITTEEDMDTFKYHVRIFIVLFGLYDWEVDFRHELSEGNKATSCWHTGVGKNVTITLSTDWGSTEVTEDALRKVAFHEVMEILMGDMWNVAIVDDLTQQARKLQLDREHHRLIRRMENCVLKYLPLNIK